MSYAAFACFVYDLTEVQSLPNVIARLNKACPVSKTHRSCIHDKE